MHSPNNSTYVARLPTIDTPDGFEHYHIALSRPLPEAGPVDQEVMVETQPKYDAYQPSHMV